MYVYLFYPHAQHAYLLTLGHRRGGYDSEDTIPYFPPVATYPPGVTSQE